MTDFTSRLARLTPQQLAQLSDSLVDVSKGRTQLVAYVVTNSDTSEEDLRSHCQHLLPEYMVPQKFVLLDTLPTTPNGKVDTKALHRLNKADPASFEHAQHNIVNAKLTNQAVDPGTHNLEFEERLLKIWRDVLELEDIDANDDYFELGGDSIANLQIIARCAKFGIHFGPSDLLQNPTVRQLAKWLDRQITTDKEEAIDTATQSTTIQSEDKKDTSETDDTAKAEMLRVLNLARGN